MYFEEAEYGRGGIPIHPAYCANVAQYLGDTEELDISDYCTSVVLEKTRNAGLVRYVIEWYSQLAYKGLAVDKW